MLVVGAGFGMGHDVGVMRCLGCEWLRRRGELAAGTHLGQALHRVQLQEIGLCSVQTQRFPKRESLVLRGRTLNPAAADF